MSLPKPKAPTPPAAAPAPPDLTPPEQRLGGEENPAVSAAQKRKKGRNALRIDLQHGASGVSAGATGVNIPSK